MSAKREQLAEIWNLPKGRQAVVIALLIMALCLVLAAVIVHFASGPVVHLLAVVAVWWTLSDWAGRLLRKAR